MNRLFTIRAAAGIAKTAVLAAERDIKESIEQGAIPITAGIITGVIVGGLIAGFGGAIAGGIAGAVLADVLNSRV